ncbi:hypothetical protein [Methyloraptor flagellatus]|uniref:Uncharacterized protein n=1 Tax=Methyloraptor flagellatus TaxID=3162530 RepID=A0AAU7X706_9HYPH
MRALLGIAVVGFAAISGPQASGQSQIAPAHIAQNQPRLQKLAPPDPKAPTAPAAKFVDLGEALPPNLTVATAFSAPQPRKMLCLGVARAKDAIGIRNEAGGIVLRVRCEHAEIDGKVVPGKPAQIATFALRSFGNAKLGARRSQAATACFTAFETYRKDPKTYGFVIEQRAMSLHCRALAIASLHQFRPPHAQDLAAPNAMSPAASKAASQIALPGVPVADFFQSRDPNGELYYEVNKKLWRKVGSREATLGFFTLAKAPTTTALIQVFDKPPVDPNPSCATWDKTPGVLATFGATLTSAPATTIARKAAAEVGIPVGPTAFFNQVTVPAQSWAGIKAKLAPNDLTANLRIVVVSGTNGPAGPSFKCALPPTAPIELDFGTSPTEQNTKAVVEAITASQKAKEEQKKAYEDARAQFLASHGNANLAPLLVTVVGYEPPFGRGGILQSTVYNHPITQEKYETYSLNAKVQGPFGKGDGFPWPASRKQNWGGNCHYDPNMMLRAVEENQQEKSKWPDSLMDQIVFIVDFLAITWDAFKDIAVQAVAYATTAGECPFSPKIAGPQALETKQPKACEIYKSAVGTGLNVAMSSVGLPPTLPSASALLDNGIEYASSVAVQYAAGQIGASAAGGAVAESAQATIGEAAWDQLSEAAKDKVRESLKDELHKQIVIHSCVRTKDDVLDSSGCTLKPTSPLNYSRIVAFMEGHPEHAVVWLKIAPNPKALRDGAGKLVTPRMNVAVTAPVRQFPDQSQFVFKDVTGKGLFDPSQLRLFAPASVTLDATTVDKNGYFMPVMLPFEQISAWLNAAQRTRQCPVDAFQPGCEAGLAKAAFGHTLELGTVGLTVGSRWQWTADPALLAACKAGGGYNCGQMETALMPERVINANRLIPDLQYGVMQISGPNAVKACPGFKYLPDQDTGLPVLSLDFDPRKADFTTD